MHFPLWATLVLTLASVSSVSVLGDDTTTTTVSTTTVSATTAGNVTKAGNTTKNGTACCTVIKTKVVEKTFYVQEGNSTEFWASTINYILALLVMIISSTALGMFYFMCPDNWSIYSIIDSDAFDEFEKKYECYCSRQKELEQEKKYRGGGHHHHHEDDKSKDDKKSHKDKGKKDKEKKKPKEKSTKGGGKADAPKGVSSSAAGSSVPPKLSEQQTKQQQAPGKGGPVRAKSSKLAGGKTSAISSKLAPSPRSSLGASKIGAKSNVAGKAPAGGGAAKSKIGAGGKSTGGAKSSVK